MIFTWFIEWVCRWVCFSLLFFFISEKYLLFCPLSYIFFSISPQFHAVTAPSFWGFLQLYVAGWLWTFFRIFRGTFCVIRKKSGLIIFKKIDPRFILSNWLTTVIEKLFVATVRPLGTEALPMCLSTGFGNDCYAKFKLKVLIAVLGDVRFIPKWLIVLSTNSVFRPNFSY